MSDYYIYRDGLARKTKQLRAEFDSDPPDCTFEEWLVNKVQEQKAEFDRLLKRDTGNLKRLISAQAGIKRVRECRQYRVYEQYITGTRFQAMKTADVLKALEASDEKT
jgi:hypothetical protein